ncbi:ATP-binding protein [Streptomyces sp. HPF1205]|uniref:ATP-binding protein n=1 Tax=Streptomyces sp. HPF1205 TaxID=2873262 RepID=UPI001CEC9ED8|nr:ATP-binding protein [Streptomyces sp. HPF1205]
MTRHIPEAVSWCIAAGALACLVLLIRQHRITAGLRKRLAVAEAGLRDRDAEARHLVEARLTAVTEGPYQPVPGPLDERLARTPFGHSMQQAVDLFTGAAQAARTRADHSAKAALKSSMRALQALANEQQLSISDMQDRHDNPHVLQDLLEIDHANAQFGRRAQAIAVLCGSWPGRQRAASPLVDVVRGATSRIRDYRRVEIQPGPEVDVVSRAVEPVVLAVAELLDNAARHSQPNTTVEVGFRPAHNGMSVVIDDAGVGMDAGEIEEAGRRLSGDEDVDINRLGDPPQFGFAVIGVLAARYGFGVTVDSRSPYGGVRAVVFLPKSLLTTASAPAAAGAGRRRETAPAAVSSTASLASAAPVASAASAASLASESTASAAAPEVPAEAAAGGVTGATAGGLPRRRRRAAAEPAAAAVREREPAAAAGEAQQARPAYETATRMGAFARGTRSGRAATDDDEGIPQE